tara:strand:- start:215 stop:415 length:201 start_codon:yes stop_codon:yes gene_type:complete
MDSFSEKKAERKLLSVTNFAYEYGVSRHTAYLMIKNNQIRAKCANGRMVIDRLDAEKWRANLPEVK